MITPPSSSLPLLLLLFFQTTLPPPIIGTHAINLDIHIPLPSNGCLMDEALRANLLLKQHASSRSTASSDGNRESLLPQRQRRQRRQLAAAAAVPSTSSSEQVDLFSRHTPHVTLFLSDFDLEVNDHGTAGNDTTARNDLAVALNQTKVTSFLNAISSINFTQIIPNGCPLSFGSSTTSTASTTYTISGPYTMLPILPTPCLQSLSAALTTALRPFLKRPIRVPSWVASLSEPERSHAIYRTRRYGSPNAGEGFVPHVTVGYDPVGSSGGGTVGSNSNSSSGGGGNSSSGSGGGNSAPDLQDETEDQLQWRIDAMKQWSDAFAPIQNQCSDTVRGIAVGETGVGGTVLANSRMGYWKLATRRGKADGDGGGGGSTKTTMRGGGGAGMENGILNDANAVPMQ